MISRILDRFNDRAVMLTAAAALSAIQLLLIALTQTLGTPRWPLLLTSWALVGASYAAVLIPSGRLVRRSAEAETRPSLFATQFSLSHVCWLLTYPLAGWVLTRYGLPTSFIVLGGIACLATAAAMFVWRDEKSTIAHNHPELPSDHPHLLEKDKAANMSTFSISINCTDAGLLSHARDLRRPGSAEIGHAPHWH